MYLIHIYIERDYVCVCLWNRGFRLAFDVLLHYIFIKKNEGKTDNKEELIR